MRTDRELLELAAKAAGMEVTAIVADGIPHRFGGGYWNPLTDDGDALRLAVQLDLNVERYDGTSTIAGNAYLEQWPHEPDGDDRAAATRRCIVRAAAEIGAISARQGDA